MQEIGFAEMVTEKEKQHYVPKFFLRRFSCLNDGKNIGIFRPQNGRFVASGPLRSQAYKRYFYGKDGILEDRLSQVEGLSAENLRQLAALTQQIAPGSLQHVASLHHLLLSDLRTPANTERLQAQIDKIREVGFSGRQLPNEFHRLKLTPEMAIEFALDFVQSGMEFCRDLTLRVIKNKTATPFITSDAPVLRYNQLLEKHRVTGGITGTAHAGLQLFMPIDARTMLVAYDAAYYRIGARTNNKISFCSERDVEQINLLSFLNCHSSLFFNHEITEDYLLRLAKLAARFPLPNQTIATKFYKVGVQGHETVYTAEEPADYPSFIVHNYSTSLKTHLVLSFMQFTRALRHFLPDQIPGNMRPHCARIHLKNRQMAGPRPGIKFSYDELEDEHSRENSTSPLLV